MPIEASGKVDIIQIFGVCFMSKADTSVFSDSFGKPFLLSLLNLEPLASVDRAKVRRAPKNRRSVRPIVDLDVRPITWLLAIDLSIALNSEPHHQRQ